MASNDRPLVGIIVSLYNHERFIVSCLDSVAADPYPRKELIVIDDGSNDNSAEVVAAWCSDNKQRFERLEFVSRENRGLCRTLNQAIEMASGEYVALLASDDQLVPEGIEARIAYLVNHPGKLAVIGDCLVIGDEGQLLGKSGIELFRGRRKHLAHYRLLDYEIVFRWCVPGPVFLAKRSLYQMVGGYDETLWVEDRDFYLRLVSRSWLGFIDRPVAAYRRHSTNTSSTRHLAPKLYRSLESAAWRNIAEFGGLRKARLLGEAVWASGKALDGSGGRLHSLILRAVGRAIIDVTFAVYDLWASLRFRL